MHSERMIVRLAAGMPGWNHCLYVYCCTTGSECFFHWVCRIHVLGLPNNRCTKALLAVACVLVPNMLAVVVNRSCLHWTMVPAAGCKRSWMAC